MQAGTFKGVGVIGSGEYSILSIDGVYNCPGDIKAEEVRVNGVLNCSGGIEADLLHCGGVSDFRAGIKVNKMEVNGIVSVSHDNKIEATEIDCTGVINIDGEISADRIYADGFICAREVVGDSVTIRSRLNTIARILNTFTKKYSTVNLIEATKVELIGVIAETVNGSDITIGPKCEIHQVDCNGVLYIDPEAQVHRITGKYIQRV